MKTATQSAAPGGAAFMAGDYVVRIRLDKSDPALRWGMTVKVTFIKK